METTNRRKRHRLNALASEVARHQQVRNSADFRFNSRRLHQPSLCIRRRLSRRSSPEFSSEGGLPLRFELRLGKPPVASTRRQLFFPPPPTFLQSSALRTSRTRRIRRKSCRFPLDRFGRFCPFPPPPRIERHIPGNPCFENRFGASVRFCLDGISEPRNVLIFGFSRADCPKQHTYFGL